MMPSSPLTTKSTVAERQTRPWLSGLAFLLFLLLAVVLTVTQTAPPNPVPASAPATEFSAERAMEHLKVIAAKPHPTNSPAHDEVRDYIVGQVKQLGLEVEVQKTTAYYRPPGIEFDRAAYTQNILARLKGTGGGGKGVLVMSHYSTAVNTNGADDSVSVSSMLETIKNLKAGEPLKRDVIFLFTDAKDPLPVGSQAFMDEHPWAKEVGYAFNFDARGSSGPVVMFETSDNNGQLISGLASSVNAPLANSLLYSLYKMTNFDTDLTMIKEDKNIQGLNFAFAEESEHFRNLTDTIEHVDHGSFQQTGEYMLGLARHFGNMPDPDEPPSSDAVFYNIANLLLIRYPVSFVLPLTALILIAFAAVLVIGLRSQKITVGRTLLGFAAFLLSLVLSAGLSIAAGMVITSMTDEFALISHALLFVVSFVLMTLAVMTAVYGWFNQKWGLLNATAGAALGWMLILIAVSFLLPAGSYLFAWPLLFTVIALWHLLRRGESLTAKTLVVLGLLALPALLLGTQFIDMVHMLLTLSTPVVIVALIALMMTMLLPQLEALLFGRRWLVPALAFLGFAALLIVGVSQPAYDEETPRPYTLFYGYDAQSAHAFWYSADGVTSAYNEHYLKDAKIDNLRPFYPQGMDFDKSFLKTPAMGAHNLHVPQLKVVEDKVSGGERTLTMHISTTSEQRPWVTRISMFSDQPIYEGLLNGTAIRNRDASRTVWELLYYAQPKEGIDLVLKLKPGQNLTMKLADGFVGLPQELVDVPRPADFTPTYFSDSTYVAQQYDIQPAQ